MGDVLDAASQAGPAYAGLMVVAGVLTFAVSKILSIFTAQTDKFAAQAERFAETVTQIQASNYASGVEHARALMSATEAFTAATERFNDAIRALERRG